MTFAVLLSSDDQLQIPALGAAFAAFRKVPVIDAAREAKGCWGIIGENLSDTEADRLIGCVALAGLKSIKMPQADFHSIASAVLLNHGAFSESGLGGIDDQGVQKSFIWDEVRVIGVASVQSSMKKTITEKVGPSPAQKAASIAIGLATGLPIPIGPKKQTVTRTVSNNEFSFVLDVLTSREECVRIFADHFNYASLKDRKVYNAMGNFKIVVGDLAAKAPQAKIGKGARLLLASQTLTAMGYETLKDLERECRWLFFRP